jgi:hypothetical protein
MLGKISHYFIPHPETHQKAKLLSWHFLIIYILIFLLVRAGLDLTSVYKPGVLGINAEMSVGKIIEDTNIERQKAGLAPLAYNNSLSEAAKLKAQNMFAENYWAHFSPSGKDPWGFMSGAGYRFSYAGENLARNFYSADDMVKAWMASPSHRENIMNPKYQDIGIAVEEGVLDGKKTTLVVQMFGHPYEAVATKPEVNLGGQKVTVEPEKPSADRLVMAAGTENLSVNDALVDPSIIVKATGISIFVLISTLLLLDFIILKKRGVFRLSSEHFAHLSFLALASASVILTKAGEIL